MTERRAVDDPAKLVRAARIMRAALERSRTDEQIREAVDAAPPLTAEQRDRLRALLRPIQH